MIALPRSDLEKQKILQKIAEKFEANRNYSEEEVNKVIQSFDVDDFVLFRRELVNFNYLGKDTGKGIYWLKQKKLDNAKIKAIQNNQKRIEKAGFY